MEPMNGLGCGCDPHAACVSGSKLGLLVEQVSTYSLVASLARKCYNWPIKTNSTHLATREMRDNASKEQDAKLCSTGTTL